MKRHNRRSTRRVSKAYNPDIMPNLTIVGLGPGGPKQLTEEARDALLQARSVVFRTTVHPIVSGLSLPGEVVSGDDLYESAADFAAVYRGIADRVLRLATEGPGVVYAVPG